MPIHPTAIIDGRAEIDPTADIGPYTVIEGKVTIGPGTRIYSHAYITGTTEIGAECQVYPFATVGTPPQDLAYTGSETFCRIGDGTIIREQASIHRGTDPGSATVVGKRCFIMATAHVAHNCHVGDDVKLVNGTLLGGHVRIDNGAFVGGGSGAHQFSRVGALAMVRGNSGLSNDLPPFFLAAGNLARCVGVNVVGMRRTGFTPEERDDVRRAYRILYRSGLKMPDALDRLEQEATTGKAREVLAFCRAPSRRGLMRAPLDGETLTA